jgi:hypothetical protein
MAKKPIHLHMLWHRGPLVLTDLVRGYSLCCKKVDRNHLTVHREDATCQKCLQRSAPEASPT